MSWIEKIKNNMIITTGDGRQYKPGWLNASFSMEFNVTEFNFPGKRGTLVHRAEVKGTRYNIEIHFQGENHLDDALAFAESSKDKRLWTISHPFYGSFFAQPTSLNFDNTGLNLTRITGTLIETITEDNPRVVDDPVDKVANDKAVLDETFSQAFANNVQPDTSDVLQLQANNNNLYAVGSKRVKLTIDAEEYFNAFNNANTFIQNATADPLSAIRALQSVLNAPGLFADSVQNRIQTLADQMDTLRISIETSLDPSSKRILENNMAGLISTMCLASANPEESDYETRDDVYRVAENVLAIYNQYLEDLDSMQTENGGSVNSYIPDADALRGLNDLVNYTLSNLFNIALDSKQQRTVILEDDSNAVVLAHRFYGLDISDENLDKFIRTNNLGINSMLIVKKNTQIVYYV